MPQPKTELPGDAWMDARVEAYVDDALPPEEHARFEACLWADPYWQEQVECARRIQGLLRSRNAPSPPAGLADALLRPVAQSASSGTEA